MEKWICMMPACMYATISVTDIIGDYYSKAYVADIVDKYLVCEDGKEVTFLGSAVEVIPNGMYVFPKIKVIYAKEEYTYDALRQLQNMVNNMKDEVVGELKRMIREIKAKELNFIGDDI